MNDYPIAGLGLQARGFDKGDGKLVIVWRCVAEGFFGPPHYFERMDLEELSALRLGKIRDPLQFVTIKLGEREDETECNPGLAQEREPVLHRFKGASGAAHAIMGFRLTIETDRDETVAAVTQPTDAAFVQQHPVGGHGKSNSELPSCSQQFTQRLVKQRLATGETNDIVPVGGGGGDRLPDNLRGQVFLPHRRRLRIAVQAPEIAGP